MAQRGVNKVILVGNLGSDPDTKHMPNGNAVTNLSLATSETWRDKQSGDQRERTEWHRVAAFGRLAEIMGEYLRKGSKVYIEGKLQTRKWQDQNGQDRYTTEILADQMQMLDSRGEGMGAPAGNYGSPPPRSNQPPSMSGGAQSGSTQPPPNFSDFDDEIPF